MTRNSAPSPSFGNYIVILVVSYLALMIIFQASLSSLENSTIINVNIQGSKDDYSYEDFAPVRNRKRGILKVPEKKVNLIGQEDEMIKNEKPEYVMAGYEDSEDYYYEDNLTETCLGKPAKNKQMNRFQIVVPDKVYVYSAYWDTRKNDFDNIDGDVIVRVMAVLHRQGTRKYLKTADIWCQVEDLDGEKVDIKATRYEMCENHGMLFGGYIVSCKIPKNIAVQYSSKLPCVINIKVISEDKDYHAGIGLRNLTDVPNKKNFGICVPPLFGDLETRTIVEFMEMSQILGTDHVTMYNYNAGHITDVLKYYIDKAELTVYPWNLPGGKIMMRSIWYFGQIIAIQDCLYRSMGRFTYIQFSDLDEFMCPLNYAKWQDFIPTIDSKSYCGMQFDNLIYFKDEYREVDKVYDLDTLDKLRSKDRIDKWRTKCMVKPQLLFEAGIHHISKPITADLKSVHVNSTQALVRHYRKSCRSCLMDHSYLDESMRTYTDQLTSRVDTVMKDLQKLNMKNLKKFQTVNDG